MEYAWKKRIFLWNNHMEKHVLFVYDGYNRYNNGEATPTKKHSFTLKLKASRTTLSHLLQE